MINLTISENEVNDLKSLLRWMDFFGFFYYVISGMYALASIIVIIMGLLSRDSNIGLLMSMSLVMIVYCIFSIAAGNRLFTSSDKFEIVINDKDESDNLIAAFENLKKFFWFYGGLITLSIVWLFFLLWSEILVKIWTSFLPY